MDQTLILPGIGIADPVGQLTGTRVQLAPGASEKAGEASAYTLYFKNTQTIPVGSFFQLNVPVASGFTLASSPGCSSPSVSGKSLQGPLKCTYGGGVVTVEGLSGEVAGGTDSAL